MPTLEQLMDLQARLEKETGQDIDFDADICVASQYVGPYDWAPACKDVRRDEDDPEYLVFVDDTGADACGKMPPLTASVDACLALVERTLPPTNGYAASDPPSSGWRIFLYRGLTPSSSDMALWEACICPHGQEGKEVFAPTAPLAILRALVSAMIAREEANA